MTAEALRWPWPALDAMTGGMMPGTVHYVVGYSGLGKSTFINSALLRWAEAGVKMDLLSLEIPRPMALLNLAAMEAGVDPGVIASGDYQRTPEGRAMRELVEVAFQRQKASLIRTMRDAQKDNPLRVRESMGLSNEAEFRGAARECKERGALALVVDHIDHLQDGEDSFAASAKVNRIALELAKAHGIVMLLLSQANAEAIRASRDHLSKYAPLYDTSVWMGQIKRQLATTMLGLYRPLREPGRDETEDAYLAAIKAARVGKEPPSTVLLPGAVGCSMMKNRNYGGREGQKVLLGWKAGRVTDYEALPYTLR